MEIVTESKDSNDVIVPLFSRFVFEDIKVSGDPMEHLEKVKESLGEWASLAELNDSIITVKSPPDIAGRGRLPNGATASDPSRWKTMLVFPDSDGGQGGQGPPEELSAEEVDMTASDIVSRNGRVVCVIPVSLFS